jgi:DnaJ-class molecular chaperone
MKNHYQTLGLEEGASQEAIQEAYDRLYKELDPMNNDNQEFFIEELEKLQEAYKVLRNSSILATEGGFGTIKVVDNLKQNQSNKTSDMLNKKISKKEIAFGIILFFIATGIWGIFLQNLGFFKSEERVVDVNKVQQVRVINTVETNSFVTGGNIDVVVGNKLSISDDRLSALNNDLALRVIELSPTL